MSQNLPEFQSTLCRDGAEKAKDLSGFGSGCAWSAIHGSIWTSGCADYETLRNSTVREHVLIVAVYERALKDLEIMNLSTHDRRALEPWAQQSAWNWVMSDSLELDYNFRWCVEQMCDAIGGDVEVIIRKVRFLARKSFGRGHEDRVRLNTNKAMEVERIVCEVYGVKSLSGKKRSGPKFEARKVAIYVMYYWLRASQPSLGRYFSRSAATIHHTLKKLNERALDDDRVVEALKRIEKKIEKAELIPKFPVVAERWSDIEDWDYA